MQPLPSVQEDCRFEIVVLYALSEYNLATKMKEDSRLNDEADFFSIGYRSVLERIWIYLKLESWP
jgi:hypothetical protein